jgi:ribosomal protein L37AE/L43A
MNCPNCGNKKIVKINQNTWHCKECGVFWNKTLIWNYPFLVALSNQGKG